jgi:hypothetical protein
MLNWTVWYMVNSTCNKFQAYREINGNKIHCLDYYFRSPNIEFFHKVRAPYNSLRLLLRAGNVYLVFCVQNKGKWHSITITLLYEIHSHLVVCSWAVFPGTLHGNVTMSMINCNVWLYLQCFSCDSAASDMDPYLRVIYFSSSSFFFFFFFFFLHLDD